MSFRFNYNPEELKNSLEANCGRPYQQCAISVMDTIADPHITFDEKGICNYYYDYKKNEKLLTKIGDDGILYQNKLALEIKNSKPKGKYNCILGLSGGADSTYLVYKAKQLGLNPLLVHFDYGWNSEIAIKMLKML